MKAKSLKQKAIECFLPRSCLAYTYRRTGAQHSAYSRQLYSAETSNLKPRTSNYFLSSDMKTKECPSCAMEVDIKSEVCPICKYQFTRQSSSLKWAALLLAILFLIYLIFF